MKNNFEFKNIYCIYLRNVEKRIFRDKHKKRTSQAVWMMILNWISKNCKYIKMASCQQFIFKIHDRAGCTDKRNECKCVIVWSLSISFSSSWSLIFVLLIHVFYFKICFKFIFELYIYALYVESICVLSQVLQPLKCIQRKNCLANWVKIQKRDTILIKGALVT